MIDRGTLGSPPPSKSFLPPGIVLTLPHSDSVRTRFVRTRLKTYTRLLRTFLETRFLFCTNCIGRIFGYNILRLVVFPVSSEFYCFLASNSKNRTSSQAIQFLGYFFSQQSDSSLCIRSFIKSFSSPNIPNLTKVFVRHKLHLW